MFPSKINNELSITKTMEFLDIVTGRLYLEEFNIDHHLI